MKPDNVPHDLLTRTPTGTWRIAGTRVSLDSVVADFWAGAAPEEICQDYPTLSLAQVYNTIAYYLNHREEIDAYLLAQRREADELCQALQARHSEFLATLRKRLATRRVPEAASA